MKYLTNHLNLLFTLLLLCAPPLSAQDEPPAEDPAPDVVESYTYHVALPATNASLLARFRLELASLDGRDFEMTVVGHGGNGQVVFQQETLAVAGSTIFAWDSLEKNQAPVQTLEVVANQRLTGALWIWDSVVGLFNGIELGAEPATEMAVPYIPTDLFTWKTLLAVKGFSESHLTGDIIFGYFDQENQYDESVAWANLDSRGYFLGGPYYGIPVGTVEEDPELSWGLVRSPFSDFFLTGAFSLVKQAGFDFEQYQGCALALKGSGSASGWVGFSQTEGFRFGSSFVFTNPSAVEDVLVTLSLQQRISVEVPADEEGQEPTFRSEVIRTQTAFQLPKLKRILLNDLSELFGEIEGVPVSLQYEATTLPLPVEEGSEEEPPAPEPRHIFAMHFQENEALEEGDKAQTMLGGHYFAAEEGNYTSHYLNFSAPFERQIELFNTTDRLQKLDVTILDVDGKPIRQLSSLVEPWEGVHHYTSTFLKEQALIAMEEQAALDGRVFEFEPDTVLRVVFSLDSLGTFFSKITGFTEQDFAIVNGSMVLLEPPVEEPIEEPTDEAFEVTTK